MDYTKMSSQHIFLWVFSESGHVVILFPPGSFRDAVPGATNAPASWIAGVVKHQGIQPRQNSAATGQTVGSFMEQPGGREARNATEVRRAVSLEGREAVARSGTTRGLGAGYVASWSGCDMATFTLWNSSSCSLMIPVLLCVCIRIHTYTLTEMFFKRSQVLIYY